MFFCDKNLTKITFSDKINIKRIEGETFNDSGLKFIQIPKSVEEIGCCAFAGCDGLKVIFEQCDCLKVARDAFLCAEDVKIVVLGKRSYLGKSREEMSVVDFFKYLDSKDNSSSCNIS
jgi:hypothetical protein